MLQGSRPLPCLQRCVPGDQHPAHDGQRRHPQGPPEGDLGHPEPRRPRPRSRPRPCRRGRHGVRTDEHPGEPGTAPAGRPRSRRQANGFLLGARVTGSDDETHSRPPGRADQGQRQEGGVGEDAGQERRLGTPQRTAKNAAIAVAKTTPATCDSDECCTTRITASTTATPSAAPAASLTSCCQVQKATKTTVGSAVFERAAPAPQGRREPVSDQGLDRLRHRRHRQPRERVGHSRGGHDLVGRVEDGRGAAHRGDPAGRPQEDPRLDAADRAPGPPRPG